MTAVKAQLFEIKIENGAQDHNRDRCRRYIMRLTDLETRIWNQGERLIPGRTHNADEARRHKSSYEFFVNTIKHDIEMGEVEHPSILDLGFGCGFGCMMLASISGAKVTGIDIGEECLEYASRHYNAPNVSYGIFDIIDFLKIKKEEFDYVVLRGVLEHIENGLDIIIKANWAARLMFDVPYAEPLGNNHHHALTNITEKDFGRWADIEIFYEDLTGRIYTADQKPQKPNMIMGAMRTRNFEAITDLFSFPIAPAP